MALTEGRSVDPAVLDRYLDVVSKRAGSRRDYVIPTPDGDKIIELYVSGDERRFLRRQKPRYVTTIVRNREPSLIPLQDGLSDEVFPFTQIIWQVNGGTNKIERHTGIATRPPNVHERPTETHMQLGSMLTAKIEEMMHDTTATEDMLQHIKFLEQVGKADRVIYSSNYLRSGKTRKERLRAMLAYFVPQPPRYEARNPF